MDRRGTERDRTVDPGTVEDGAPRRIEPSGAEAWAPEAAVDEQTFRTVLRDAVDALAGAGIFYVLIGGIASAIVGRPRWTWDVDVLVARVDADDAAEALRDAGFTIAETELRWLFKVHRDGVLVDVIFQSEGGIHLDDEMRRHAIDVQFQDVAVRIASPEDLIVMKALAHREEVGRYWYDALGIIAERDLDWEYLVERSRHSPRRMLSLLFYAQSEDLMVPESAVRALFGALYD